MSLENIFERHEKKYMLNRTQYLKFCEDIKPYMQIDQYGRYTVNSLYLDTANYFLIRQSIEKPSYKEKLRLRAYGVPKPGDTVYFELKKKFAGVVYKRRVPMTWREAVRYMNSGEKPVHSQVMEEIDWFVRRYRPAPKAMIAYERVALYGVHNQGLRITFDFHVRWRGDYLDLTQGNDGALILDDDYCLMEIKAPVSFPFWLGSILAKSQIYPTSFSKYGTCYKNFLSHSMGDTQYVG